jgi:phospholipase C
VDKVETQGVEAIAVWKFSRVFSWFNSFTFDETRFPAVAIIAPYDSISGHPGYAMQPSFEGLVEDVVRRVQDNPALWKKTAILITFDEGGGHYDSSYVQFIDFFGDGPRIPLLAISPYARGGYVDHTYYDHASIAKFIERNWSLPPLSARSRDNLPNPVHGGADPYVPTNRPAIGDLMNMFDFSAADETATNRVKAKAGD